MTQYLLGDLKLRWNGSNPSVGGGALFPRERSLKEAVKLRKGKSLSPKPREGSLGITSSSTSSIEDDFRNKNTQK